MTKILIVEDDEFLSDIYKIKFVAEGFEVFVAANGEEGVAMAKKEKPDLIFLDLVMPVMNGYEALDAIRKDEEIKDTLIIILSNLGQEEEVAEAMSKGANAFLIKASLTPKDLVAKAREILSINNNEVLVKGVELEINAPLKAENINGIKILFIEDNKEIIQMYLLQFEKSGYSVELAENGAWGLKLAQEKKFDVIVMDMVMPAMNGYDMLKTIKSDSMNKETPVIVISNSSTEEEIEETMAIGATKYIVKSDITPGDLIKEISALVLKNS